MSIIDVPLPDNISNKMRLDWVEMIREQGLQISIGMFGKLSEQNEQNSFLRLFASFRRQTETSLRLTAHLTALYWIIQNGWDPQVFFFV